MMRRFHFICVLPDLSKTRQFLSVAKIEKITKKLLLSFEKNKLIKQKKSTFLNITLASQTEIKKLNLKYRRKNKVTDVLSFEQSLKYQPKDQLFLGDLVLCLEKAKEQATLFSIPLEEEVRILICHGILHLLGFDHEKSAKKALEMGKIEKKILQKTGLITRSHAIE